VLGTALNHVPVRAGTTVRFSPGFPRCAKLRTLLLMQGEMTDEDLMLAYGAGDAAAFEALYSRHRGPLFRFLLRQSREHALAEELYQDVWQRVITARERYRPEAKFSTWLYQIAHNRLTDHWRAQAHRPAAPEDAMDRAEREPDPQTPERQLSAFEERRRLQLALEELPADQREAVLLRLEQELSLEEIGKITGVGRETVKSRLRYALDKLRHRLNT
jgi:RNA polymerase sigma-70 factor (ECF subfamily)